MSNSVKQEPELTRQGALDMQVCVPKGWTDAQVVAFANRANWSGLDAGWQIRKEGDPALDGDPERVQCNDLDRAEFVHVMLVC